MLNANYVQITSLELHSIFSKIILDIVVELVF